MGEIRINLAPAPKKSEPFAEFFPVFTAKKDDASRRRGLDIYRAVLIELNENVPVQQIILIRIFKVRIGDRIAAEPALIKVPALHHKKPCVTAGIYRVI